MSTQNINVNHPLNLVEKLGNPFKICYDRGIKSVWTSEAWLKITAWGGWKNNNGKWKKNPKYYRPNGGNGL